MKSKTRQWLTAGVIMLAALVVFGALVVQRSRGSDSDEAAEPAAEVSETDTKASEDDAAAEAEPEPEDSETETSIAPAEAVVLDVVSNGDHWLGRGTMTASSVQLFWAPVEAADQYNIYRVDDVSGFDSDSIALTEAELVYDGTETVFVDTSVQEGAFYTYIMEVQVGEELLPRRWAQTLAADDTVPPEPITGLTAERTAEGILLQWDPTDDDVEFSSYSVSLVQGDQLTYLGGGGDIEAISFIDRNPPTGPVTYSVEAVDFHDNRTEAVEITVEPT